MGAKDNQDADNNQAVPDLVDELREKRKRCLSDAVTAKLNEFVQECRVEADKDRPGHVNTIWAPEKDTSKAWADDARILLPQLLKETGLTKAETKEATSSGGHWYGIEVSLSWRLEQ
eukprot:TRINITY_DN41344_c0_g1_i1.p2 TRINITY_DN41344_c0_g1~~TRINITY_DN41344_c0_g1_i1.p2  ORF type:complete len:117 (+),score=31.85 TRINITY_DN41344_c0_g1_i1:76-426(+)